ncbi:DEAD/DEAH box helicase [Treponema sp. OMZ 840]|uniref:DEAD/DEAH box helicase n=1 Tax=Treponema sp. OMZ 840 TaxID=244313 RepID=UPI003D94DFFB
MDFSELNLDTALMEGIQKAGYVTCTPVQERVLTGAFEGADLYVQSQTGTGKTAAYLITVIQQMLANPKMTGKKALVMVPTRELTVQVEEEAKNLLSATKLKAASFYGGVGYTKQTALLKKGVDIIIGTPGRLIDLQESGIMDLSTVGFLVVDEADRMFDMGFYPDLRKLIKVLPKTEERQTMLFSATLNTYVKNLAWEYTDNAQEITIEAEHITVDEIDQMLLHVSSDDKIKLLLGILKKEKAESVLIFCNTKRSCEVIAKRLGLNGIESEFIIGDLPQSKRLQVLNSFKSGSLTCLVATDVAARGIDVNDLAMVINFDLPNEAENYVHRIGRTARAGKSGKAYTFCSEQDVYNLPAIERYLGNPIPSSVAGEEQFAEDKSAGVYIKTGFYREDGDYEGGRGGRRAKGPGSKSGRFERSSSGRSQGRFGKRGGDFAGGFKEGKKHSKTDSHYAGTSAADKSYKSARDISSLSFEERMKFYREKYGGEGGAYKADENRTSFDERGKKKGKAQGGFKRKGGKSERFTKKRDGKNYAGADSAAAKAAYSGNADKRAKTPAKGAQTKAGTPAKKGLFAAIKGLFGKKK